MNAIRDIMRASPVMPVIVLERVADAVPLAEALVSGGIRVLEVTMRTPAALDCVRAIRAAVPDAIVGAGTICSLADLQAAREAGAAFGVSPGATSSLLAGATASNFPFLPGVMTPSDVLHALAAGFSAMKLFPAKQAGGIDMLKAMGGPFPQVLFCPTGGIDAESAVQYLALANVVCVGGSWLAPADLVAQKNWPEIERRARQAAKLALNRAAAAAMHGKAEK